MANLSINLTEAEVDMLLRDTDYDKDGKVNYQEFLMLVKTKYVLPHFLDITLQ